ncbi:VOC family protein [Xanthomonas citri pv. fuscans CFBP 6996]|uniref:VOC family protein n=1 Tax=Xanthomonas citri TaxID=346 RepID=UPI000C179A4C|nr:VOC family protein [Xanthomonas citri]ATS50549.1 VOC family protein [Xanthomonas citri pv. phaseoli var. fuscans]ATS56285.1 VOC family protein [Xanthomonas citri pv. phaseoli var. fuscans]ATS59704.1 VOC family protein [Xanthomonas citri pv. phaseoli var. fuscans]PTY31223.1 VOC family protein [Xanthomonas citri pv. fuscans CFBP 6996]QWN15158.1 VOC family protein [Xanthomonas citri]
MLHHVSLGVRAIDASATLYDAALGALGYVRVWSDLEPGTRDQAVGYGRPGGEDCLALKQRQAARCAPGAGFHLAFASPDASAVDAFHRAALQHGGRCNGAPGLRPDYGDDYYAAFVIDPDGHHIEAVVARKPPR